MSDTLSMFDMPPSRATCAACGAPWTGPGSTCRTCRAEGVEAVTLPAELLPRTKRGDDPPAA